MASQRLHGYCALCISRCGCIATVQDDQLIKVEGDPDHPTGGGFCAKGRAAPELVHSPLRLLHPLRRIGPRGAPTGWEEISWDEALDSIAHAMRQAAASAGPESVAVSVTTPSGTAISDSTAWIHRLARSFGTPNVVFATENCNWHRDFSPQYTFGSGIGMPDLEHCGCLLLWGTNPSASLLSFSVEIRKARQRGMKLVVIDPRDAGLARGADLWLQPRPGSDAALALAMAQVLLEQGGVDEAFLQQWSNAPYLVREDNGQLLRAAGLDPAAATEQFVVWNSAQGRAELAGSAPAEQLALRGSYCVATAAGEVICRPAFDYYAATCAAMPPERAAELTGVPAEKIRAAAHLLRAAAPAAFYSWTGLCQHSDATQTTRAVCLLYALTGQLDAPGGNVFFPRPAINDVSGLDLLPLGRLAQTLGRAERPLGPGRRGWISAREVDLALAQQPSPLKVLLSFGGNPLATKPLSGEALKHFDNLDFFAISELFMTPTAALADIVLPAASAWEREALYGGFHISRRAEAHLQLRPAFVSPRGESKPDSWIVFELAQRLGLGEHFFECNRTAALRHVLQPSGITPEQLRAQPQGITLDLPMRYHKYREQGFATPTGKLEIYSEALLQHGHAPVPSGEGVPPADPAYPLTLLSAKQVAYCHSQMRSLPSLMRLAPEPVADIHPHTAASRGIREGEWMQMLTPRGKLAAKARFNAGLAPEVVSVSYGWHAAMQPQLAASLPPGVTLNFADIADPAACDPISGSDALKRVPCEALPLTRL